MFRLQTVQLGHSNILGAGHVTEAIGVVSGACGAYQLFINVGAIEHVSSGGTDGATRAFKFLSVAVFADSPTVVRVCGSSARAEQIGELTDTEVINQCGSSPNTDFTEANVEGDCTRHGNTCFYTGRHANEIIKADRVGCLACGREGEVWKKNLPV